MARGYIHEHMDSVCCDCIRIWFNCTFGKTILTPYEAKANVVLLQHLATLTEIEISFEQEQIRSMKMTLASSTLQIRRHEDFRDLNIVIFVGIGTLAFYAINMDDRIKPLSPY
ncbi:transmembrane protein, putative [Medicago truncatula]|uniref:Transmembrane protein, putative n=1 Tax=Medicago truncatula TaxID=3880 RepID=A0A072UBK4_MEDTR|nr:transmembrane protein, putative [Medicago truncatula]